MPSKTISGRPINGPWDMTSSRSDGENSTLFVTNVLNGTVASGETPVEQRHRRAHPPARASQPQAAEGRSDRRDRRTASPSAPTPAALVVGPTGVALGDDGTLYVADTQGNRIAAVPDASARPTPTRRGRDHGRQRRLSSTTRSA